MANLTEVSQWETGIYRIETTDPVIGGETGISNKQAKLLGNRTLYLKAQTDDHETRIVAVESSSNVLQRLKGAGSLVKQGIVTSALTNNVFDFMSVAKITTSPILNRVTVAASVTDPLVLGFSKGYDANGPILYYGVVTSNQQVDSGSNTSGLVFAEYNETTGAVTFGFDTSTTSMVVSYSNPGTTGYWYSLKDEKLYKWSGSAWVVEVRVIIASVSWSGSGSFQYFLPVGKGVKDVFGRGHVPAGTVSAFAGASAPNGYLLCDGGAISRSIYSDLFASLGITYGAGDGSTTFNIPDLRGEFLRGLDAGRGVDLDSFSILATTTSGSASITNADTTGLVVGMSISGTGIPAGATITTITGAASFVISANATATGNFVSLSFTRTRTLGSSQVDQFKLHSHKVSRLSNVVNSGTPTTAALTDWENAAGVQSTDNVQPVGGAETRPRNIAMNFIIKF